MPAWFAVLVIASGFVIFSMSLLYLRAHLRFRSDMRMLGVQDEAIEASRLPPLQAQAELARIARPMRELSGSGSGVANGGTEDASSAEVTVSQLSLRSGARKYEGDLLESLHRIELQLSESDQVLVATKREVQEELSRLREQIAAGRRE